MGFMRTLDRNFLAATPTVGTPATITLSVEIPDSTGVPANADGTKSSITLSASGPNYFDVLVALGHVNDMGAAEIVGGLLMNCPDDVAVDTGSAEAVRTLAHEIITPFRTFDMTLTLTEEGEGGERTKGKIELAITAPSYVHAGSAVASMTRPHMLTQVAVGLCPEVDDEDSYGDSVLVV